MTTIGATVQTLVDFAKGLDPNGSPARVIEMLSKTDEIILDMLWSEGNLPTGHRTTVRTGLPTATFRLLNNGVAVSKSTKAQIDEQCAKIEAWSQVDVALAKLGGNPGAARMSEARAFVEAMNQTFATTLWYGSAVNPEQFVGFAPRYSSLSAGNSQNIIDAAGTGADNTSIWLVVWGEDTVHGIYPKGSVAGLQHNDLGEETVTVVAGTGAAQLMRAYRDQFIWDCGIALKDWRYAVRIANIDVSDLVANSAPADITTLMIRALSRLPNGRVGTGRAAWYMNGTVIEMLDIQRRDDVQTGGQLRYDVVDGQWTPSFRGIPIRRSDSLILTEARVT